MNIQEINSIRDMSMALFLGIDLDQKYHDLEVAKRNAFLTEHFSRIVAEANLESFKEKLKDAKTYDQIIQERPLDTPFVDVFGRVTFLYIVIGGIQFPIYQPGGIMFETAVVSDSKSSVVHGGS
jgi:hypothetical protein